MADKVYSIDINAPIERVWQEVTAPGRVQVHMFGCVLDRCTPGQRYRWHSKNGKRVFVKGSIVEVSPPKPGAGARFVQTFQFTTLSDPESLVTWDLSRTGPSSTKIVVTHSKLEPGSKTATQIDGGWPSILSTLKSIAETGKAPLGKRIQLAMMNAMSFVLPKSTLAVNNPE